MRRNAPLRIRPPVRRGRLIGAVAIGLPAAALVTWGMARTIRWAYLFGLTGFVVALAVAASALSLPSRSWRRLVGGIVVVVTLGGVVVPLLAASRGARPGPPPASARGQLDVWGTHDVGEGATVVASGYDAAIVTADDRVVPLVVPGTNPDAIAWVYTSRTATPVVVIRQVPRPQSGRAVQVAAAFDRAGRVRWTLPLPTVDPEPVAALRDGSVVFDLGHDRFRTVGPDGRTRWQVSVDRRGFKPARVTRDRGLMAPLAPVLVGTGVEPTSKARQIVVVDPESGRIRDRAPVGYEPVIVGDQWILAATSKGGRCTVRVFDLHLTIVDVSPALACGDGPSDVTVTGRAILVYGERSSARYLPEKDHPTVEVADGVGRGRDDPVRLTDDGLFTEQDGHVEWTNRTGRHRAPAESGVRWDTESGTVVVARRVLTHNPFTDPDLREVAVYDVASGRRCTAFRVATPVVLYAIDRCRAVVVAPGPDPGGAPRTIYVVGP